MTGRPVARAAAADGGRSGEISVRPVGDRAFLVEAVDNEQVHMLAAAVRHHYATRIEDVVPGQETLLLCWPGRPPPIEQLEADLGALARDPPGEAGTAGSTQSITIPVCYDGADLQAVARAVGLGADRVIELHTEPDYLVAFMGFAPGFAYLTGGSPQLRLPRRPEPRAQVPAGSVALASTYSAVYPRSAPGGWHLLGRTDTVLFDPDRERPALLEAGMRVSFEPR